MWRDYYAVRTLDLKPGQEPDIVDVWDHFAVLAGYVTIA